MENSHRSATVLARAIQTVEARVLCDIGKPLVGVDEYMSLQVSSILVLWYGGYIYKLSRYMFRISILLTVVHGRAGPGDIVGHVVCR